MRCIHCLLEAKNITDDHVFPNSWYPDNTPESVQRWKAPSCLECNGMLGEVEERLFSRLALTLNPQELGYSGIAERAMRSYGVRYQGNDEKEKRFRENRRQKIIREISTFSGEGCPMPGEPSMTLPKSRQTPSIIPILGNDMKIVYEKIIRGCEYVLGNKRYIEHPYILELYDNNGRDAFESVFSTRLPTATLGPGFEVKRGYSDEDPLSVMYKATFWHKYDIMAIILIP